ncbi:MAG: chloramphenicol phosphotransferase, partial [Mesorhizobium sp.]
QYERVHNGIRYDLEVDTSAQTLQCARRIQQRFQL